MTVIISVSFLNCIVKLSEGSANKLNFTSFQEAASLGIVSCVSLKETPIVVDVRKFQVHTAEVSLH